MVGTSYYEVYIRANAEFQDPMLKKLLESNTILFTETMYNFLENSIPQFNSPVYTVKRLRNRTKPYTMYNQFIGDGTETVFYLIEYPSQEIEGDCIFETRINNVVTVTNYDSVNKTISFDVAPEVDSIIECSIYYIGGFNVHLNDEEMYILSQFVVSCWAEYVTNDKLDIMRLLGDTDFKLTSNASTTQSKVIWNRATREVAIKRMHKYSWDYFMMGVDGE